MTVLCEAVGPHDGVEPLGEGETGGGVVDEHGLELGQALNGEFRGAEFFLGVLGPPDVDGHLVGILRKERAPVRALDPPELFHLVEVSADGRLADVERARKGLHRGRPMHFEVLQNFFTAVSKSHFDCSFARLCLYYSTFLRVCQVFNHI